MPAGQLSPVLRYIRRVGGAAERDDGDRALLERFARSRDAEAFAALVRRHGPMVLAVCRRVLHNSHDADDAFQAVFLLLVRKAGSLRRPEQLGPWLHGVAHRVALKARCLGLRRREEPLTDAPAPPAPDGLVWRDLRPVLDDAVRSLPAKYRAPFVLCYLQGMTHAEAARHLGCPPGTVATRLSRAREQLRARLVRRGVTLSAAALAAALAHGATNAAVPPALLGTALRAVTSSGTISAYVAALTEGVCKAMLMEKLRFVVMTLVAAAAVGALVMGYRSTAAEPDGLPPPAAPPAVPPVAVAPRAEKEEGSATVRTKNFEVTAPTRRVARLVADAAERHRKDKAILWLGKEPPAWPERCPLAVQITMNGAGGATTFVYDAGKVESRTMHLEGTLDRILSSALPHEVTHTIFADFFAAPIPRWADEGGSLLSEDEEEQQRHATLMRQIAGKSRFIPLRRLLALKEYPADVMALYVEGHALTCFFVEKKDRKTFLAFVKQGDGDGWDKAVKEHYDFRDVDDLERAWLEAVRKEAEVPVAIGDKMPLARTGLPEAAPLAGLARLQPDGKGIFLDVIHTKLVYRSVCVKYRDGRNVPELESTAHHRTLKIAVPFSEVEAYDTDGKAIDPKKLPDLLKKETAVLVAPARSTVHPSFLKLVKEETLLIVVNSAKLVEEPAAGQRTLP